MVELVEVFKVNVSLGQRYAVVSLRSHSLLLELELQPKAASRSSFSATLETPASIEGILFAT